MQIHEKTAILPNNDTLIRRVVIFIYGIFSYSVGLGALVWFMLFIEGWEFLPLHIDSKIAGSLSSALFINASLIILFALQHSLMARPAFKKRWIRIIPQTIERSTYVLLSGIIMGLICLYWQPINGMLWQIEHPLGQTLLIAGYFIGWSFAIVATFLINHFELFGLQQVYFNLLNNVAASPSFVEKGFYKIVRHPLQLGVLIGLWSAPSMSITHAMLSLSLSLYIFIGLYYEEKDLVTTLGADYEDYQQRVRMIVPLPK